MKLTTAQLDEIERAAKKATPGSWRVAIGNEIEAVNHGGMTANVIGLYTFWDEEKSIEAEPADLTHIATMDPATTLALVAEVRELRRQRKRVVEDSRGVVQRYWGAKGHYDLGITAQARVTLTLLGEAADTASILREAQS